MVYKWPNIALSRIFPSICLLCGDKGEAGRDLCAGCLADLPHNIHCCHGCGLPTLAQAGAGSLCGRCLANPLPFDRVHAAFVYEYPVDRLIGGLKFRGKLAVGRLMASLLGDYLESSGSDMPDLIVPVPLHGSRLAKRGYNQALEIARPLGRRLGIPVDFRCSIRTRPTSPQSDLDRPLRRGNVRDAFAVREPPGAKHLALVDDTVTTASTVAELAKAFKRSGVTRVDVWALARTPRW